MGLDWWFSARKSVLLFAWEQGMEIAPREVKQTVPVQINDRKTTARYTPGSNYPAGEVIWSENTSCSGMWQRSFRMKSVCPEPSQAARTSEKNLRNSRKSPVPLQTPRGTSANVPHPGKNLAGFPQTSCTDIKNKLL
jgi:hypothetical protein